MPAFYVCLDVEGLPGVFEDNLFPLLPDRPKTVHFEPRDPPGVDILEQTKRGLKVFHLRGTYR
jgi:hypothetical protein